MCVIIHKPANEILTCDIIEKCYDSNADGFGVSWYDKHGIMHTRKGVWGLKTIVRTLSRLQHRELVCHFRWSTHGTISKDNCHPFMVANGDALLFHNGILPDDISCEVRGTNAHKSDTRILAELIGDMLLDELVGFLPELESWHGEKNRLLAMLPNGDVLKTGEWKEKHGCWFSNLNWETSWYGSRIIGRRNNVTKINGYRTLASIEDARERDNDE
jgi:predicted glutamine amidotransferase